MRIGLLRQTLDDSAEALRGYALQPANFQLAFDDLTPEERMAIMADLAEVARLSVTLIELVGDYYREEE